MLLFSRCHILGSPDAVLSLNLAFLFLLPGFCFGGRQAVPAYLITPGTRPPSTPSSLSLQPPCLPHHLPSLSSHHLTPSLHNVAFLERHSYGTTLLATLYSRPPPE
ncbi:hypothetical protein BDZ45DRAFT_678942 [Acephala macrosclerotiorum]|nr:hypothetical protein BDZ45DRAFT_678942 [Acephala macrosclerotiorum]